MQRPDIRRKGEGASTSGQSDTQPGGDHVDKEAEYRRHEDIPEGAGAQDPGGMAMRHTNPMSTSYPARISSWLGLSYKARALVQDPRRIHPPADRQANSIVTARRMTCQAHLCSPTMTQPSSVRGFSTTSPRSSRTFSLHRSSIRVISRLHWLRSITSPHSAITHRRPNHSFIRVGHSIHPSRRSTTIRPTTPRRSHWPTRLSAHGHSGHRGITIRPHAAHHPISTIAQRERATETRQRDISDLATHALPPHRTARSLVSMGCVRTPALGVPLLSAQTASLLGVLNQVYLVPDAGGDGTAFLLASHV
ncbi:hypothetical protein PIB30_080292, partial [Stylosanthes scabra]|nr:hypothetical protein [Stylosanthes scabra]